MRRFSLQVAEIEKAETSTMEGGRGEGRGGGKLIYFHFSKYQLLVGGFSQHQHGIPPSLTGAHQPTPPNIEAYISDIE